MQHSQNNTPSLDTLDINSLNIKDLVEKILEIVKEREKQIIVRRYGLLGNVAVTLKAIGDDYKLTRERIRQIEKEVVKQLRNRVQKVDFFDSPRKLITSLIHQQGGAVAEKRLLSLLGADSEEKINAYLFVLTLIPEVKYSKGKKHVKPTWSYVEFDISNLEKFIQESKKILNSHGKVVELEKLVDKVKATEHYKKNATQLADHVIHNYLLAAEGISTNVFGLFGLSHWPEIKPGDVGDKAYLIYKHIGTPQHYVKITEIINTFPFDDKKANSETVHNKLIKDERFVLIGRGIYALSEWGYKPGVVADVVEEVLREAGKPMTREEIIKEVSKVRIVKTNTIAVALANKKRFKRVAKNQFSLADGK